MHCISKNQLPLCVKKLKASHESNEETAENTYLIIVQTYITLNMVTNVTKVKKKQLVKQKSTKI